MASPLPPVDVRIEQIANGLNNLNESVQKRKFPGLRSLLNDYVDPTVVVDDVKFHRGLLQVFKNSEDTTYEQILEKQTPDEQERIEKFVAGGSLEDAGDHFVMGPSPGCRDELAKMLSADSIFKISAGGPTHVKGLSSEDLKEESDGNWFHEAIQKLGELFHHDHHDNDSVLVYKHAKFQNWGLNVINTPALTCVPTSVKGIQRIVKYAVENDMTVRCSGYRHSWSPLFGRTASNGQILISTLQLSTASKLPNIASLPLPETPPTELESIEIVKDGTPRTQGNFLVRIGCATTNERLRRWCVKNNRVTIPANVILVEITLGGSNAPICHGAGRSNQTLSDLVRKIEYVDVHGDLQSVEKPEHLRAASGCFGLMGVVTHITMEFPPMTYAMLAPVKMPVVQAVPPPPGMTDDQIPPALLKGVNRSPEQKAKDQADFEKRADDYYCEWFWFPFSDYSWVNTWNHVTDPTGVKEFPDDIHIFLSFVQTVLMNILQYTPLLDELVERLHFSEAAVTLISRAAMFALPAKPVKTFLPDALHFQRAIQNVRVRDIELQMPLVAKAGEPSKVDYSIVQRAWWDAILKVYEPKNREKCPMRMPLEMRMVGSSNVVMAPQRGNTLGTCAIEVLTLQNQSADHKWNDFAQEVLDKWMSYKDPATGKLLNTRPHWAKEWKDFTVGGVPWAEKLKTETYKDEIVEFKSILREIGKEHGWTLEDLKKRFSNDFLDEFYFGDVGVANKSHANGRW